MIEKIKELALDLKINGIKVEYNTNNDPYLGSSRSNGIEGYYFRKNDYLDFTKSEKIRIQELLLEYGFEVINISDYELEYDGDRAWKASISFTKKLN